MPTTVVKLACLLSLIALVTDVKAASIDAIFFAQTHVQQVNDQYFVSLISDREALIKAHIISPERPAAPVVEALLTLNGQTLRLTLTGPNILPSSIDKRPGKIRHSFSNTFTAYIPKEWVKPGLRVSVITPDDRININNLSIGAPTEVLMTMFDVHYFELTTGDYTDGWENELVAKWPVAKLSLTRTPNVVFEELVIPARAGVPAVKVSSREDYLDQTGIRFDGEQAAASQWNRALKQAAGTRGRVSLYYTNIYGVPAGGQAGGFAGVGNGKSAGILHHELGHALSLPHWGNNSSYPYKGDMFGVPAPNIFNGTHAGPTWAFDLPSRKFIPATVQSNSVARNPVVGTYKADPMQGGGSGDQEQGFIFRHFSDFSVKRMQSYLEGHVLVWDEARSRYASWNQSAGAYTNAVTNNGIHYPVQRNVDVMSVMASISASSPDVNMLYPPIGPYKAGLIELYDPKSAADRQKADEVFCPQSGCDLSLRILQGGSFKTYLLASSWDPTIDPLSSQALNTRAINLPTADGEVRYAELLLTPDAEQNGFPSNPTVLAKWGEKPFILPAFLLDLLSED